MIIDEADQFLQFELPEKPKAVFNDNNQLGRHRLMCGDSTNKAHIELLMDGEKADLLITDPPFRKNFGEELEAGLKIKNDNKTASEFYSFLRSAFSSTYDNAIGGASFYACPTSSEVINFVNSLVDSQPM
ncbi:hypothetical protein [Enterococcus faecalis]|uniref:hypothetical protein n=1 Tax=Enterococcus faecalis TaxID=1351 RepID=UPI003DA18E7B